MNQKLVLDLFCGLGGWTEAFLNAGYRAVGFDIEAHDYGDGGYPGELVVCDIRTLNGRDLVSKYGVPNVIVASPPCQEYSYMAMPWKLAKSKIKKIEADPKERERLTELFSQCWRIQREASEAAGHYVPMVVENVRGAQQWVGRARWNFGSFYLWGDIPVLMPIPAKIRKTKDGSWDQSRKNYNPNHSWKDQNANEGFKSAGLNWSDQSKRGQDFTRVGAMQAGLKMVSNGGRRTDIGTGARFTSRDCGSEGVKGFTPHGQPLGKNELGRKYGSKSKKRKQASAEIAKIPPALAAWIAKVYA